MGFELSHKDFSIINLLALPRAPRRSRPPSALPATRLGKGGFAPFTPTKEETQLTDKPKFENIPPNYFSENILSLKLSDFFKRFSKRVDKFHVM